MRRIARLVFLSLSICAPIAAASHHAVAVALPASGERVTGDIILLGKRIPLPPGEWRVASSGFGQVIEQEVVEKEPGPSGAIGGVLLIRPSDGVREFLLIHTNVLPARDGWGQPLECTADTALFRAAMETRNGHEGCGFVTGTRLGWLARSRLPALAGDAAALALLPPWALLAGFRVSDRRDVLDIRYGVVPPAGLAASSWFAGADRLTEAQSALVSGLGAWTSRAREIAFAALRDPADQVPSLPAPTLTGPPDAMPAEEQISAVQLGLYKLATYRLPTSLAGMLIAWAMTGNIYTGAEVMLWQSATHSLVYFGNELAWEWPRTIPLTPFVTGRDRIPTGDGYRPEESETHKLAAMGSGPRASPNVSRATEAATFVALDGKQAPLPGDRWVVMARDSVDGISGMVLARMDSGGLAGLAVVHTNQQKRAAIFGTSNECGRGDVWFALIRYDTPEDGYCLYGKQMIPSHAAAGNKLWGAALERLDAAGVTLPPSLLTTGLRARTRENLLDVRYYFSQPAALANRDRDDAGLSADPIAALQVWADLMQEPMELGVRGRGPAPEAHLPWPWDTAAVNAGTIEQAHGPLLALAASGVLDTATLRRQLARSDALLAARESQRWSLWNRSAYKVATYRAASYVDGAAVYWLVTGNASQGFTYASVTGFVLSAMAYVNEIGWAYSGIGQAPATLTPVDFMEIGHDFQSEASPARQAPR